MGMWINGASTSTSAVWIDAWSGSDRISAIVIVISLEIHRGESFLNRFSEQACDDANGKG